MDPAAYAAMKKTEREQYYAKVESLLGQIARDPEKFALYLTIQGRMPAYSLGNALMIAAQYPEARQIKLATQWADLGVKPLKGTRGIQILVPGKTYLRADRTLGQAFDVKKAFDISQTTAAQEARPPRPTKRMLLKALLDYQKGGWQYKLLDQGPAAHYDPESNCLYLLRRQTPEALFPVLAREVLRADLHIRRVKTDAPAEDVATCGAYMLCAHYDISPEGLTLPDPAQIMGGDPQWYRSRLKETTQPLRSLISHCERITAKELDGVVL